MSILNTASILYHTSYTIIDEIDLSMCKQLNDFGRGFYLTTSKDQALRFINAAIRKSRRNLTAGYILSYQAAGLGGLGRTQKGPSPLCH